MTFGRTRTSTSGEFEVLIDGNGYLFVKDYSSSTGFCLSMTSTIAVNTGKIVHVAFVKNGYTSTYYIDGKIAGTATYTCSVVYSSSVFVLGADVSTLTQYFVGYMNHAKLFNYALTSSQVVSLYLYPDIASMSPSVQPTTATPSIAAPSVAPSISRAPSHQSNWQSIRAPATVWNPKLLTDGSVLLFTLGQSVYKLSPDKYGSYVTGTFSRVASLPQNYGPLYCASAVLPDGRVIVQGGEYNYPSGRNITGAVYNPVNNTWVVLNAPSFLFGKGGKSIADASSAVLPNGQFMLQGWGTNTAILNADTLTWQQSFHRNKLEGVVVKKVGCCYLMVIF